MLGKEILKNRILRIQLKQMKFILFLNFYFLLYRFLQCTYQKFSPTSNINGKTIEFKLDRYDAANVYLIQDTNIEVTVLITKEDGTVPDTSKIVAPINNFLHSIFEAVRLTINDIPLTVTANNYPYKAYISNCLTYSSYVKAAQLNCQGWYSDLGQHMGPVEVNSGFVERSNLFRKNYDPRSEYKATGTTLIGRLMHDLVSCETGLPPNTKVKNELDRSENSFCLMCLEDDKEKYKIKIENIALYIPGVNFINIFCKRFLYEFLAKSN